MKKKALLSSIITVMLCLSIIAGSTFALFTSKTEVNIAITSGEVDVVAAIENFKLYSVVPVRDGSTGEVEDENGMPYNYQEQSVTFLNSGTATVDASLIKLDRITPGDKIEFNVGVDNGSNVKIAHRFNVTCLEGYGLMSGLNVTINGTTYTGLESFVSGWSALDENASIADDYIEIVIELPVEAGNEFQNLSTLINVTVEAVQANANIEIGGAPAIDLIEKVDSAADLEAALAAGGEIVLGGDIVLPADVITVAEDTVLWLQGNDLDASACAKRPFELNGGADLTIVATGSDVKVGNYGLVYIPDGESDVTLIGGNYYGNTDKGSFIKPKGDDPINITMTDVGYTDVSDKNWLIDAASYAGDDLNITINGGTFNVWTGVTAHSAKLDVNNAELNVKILGVEAGSGTEATIENCEINVVSGGEHYGPSPSACVSASGGGAATVNNCVLTSDYHVFALYSEPTSAITANGCTITHTGTVDAYAVYEHQVLGDAVLSNIVVNP